ncbi:MAG: hypothetical protein RL272_552 [Candidatus Parcubacteria bacterium]|jgi:hypothetical protein
MTPSHVLAAQTAGRFASAFLTLILVIQPVRVSAESVTGLDITPTLTATGEVLKAAETAVQGPPEPPTVQEVLLGVCREGGYDEDCAKTLLGIMWKESRNDAGAIGDGGRARGYFQIHYRLHRISLSCAEDLRCSAAWTLKYMESNGYPKYPNYAIQCHNGCGIKNGYAASVLRNARRLWSDPMTVEVALAK